jgi:hypothetical protein
MCLIMRDAVDFREKRWLHEMYKRYLTSCCYGSIGMCSNTDGAKSLKKMSKFLTKLDESPWHKAHPPRWGRRS